MNHSQRQLIPVLAPALDDHHIEHLAVCASEYGDTATEQLCDAALDDPSVADELLDVIDRSSRYQDWMLRGINRGYEQR